MDYKYIEELLERYWRCETSLEEEEILCAFFRQKDVPTDLLRYKTLFAYGQEQKDLALGDDFDEKILSEIEKPAVQAQRLTLWRRCMPLFKAAAVVALVLSVEIAVQHSLNDTDKQLDYNYEAYKDTYDDPQMAYEQISTALMMVSDGLNKSLEHELATDTIVSGACAKEVAE